MNCKSITDAEKIPLDIFVILQSPNVVKKEHDRLKRKSSFYETSAEPLTSSGSPFKIR